MRCQYILSIKIFLQSGLNMDSFHKTKPHTKKVCLITIHKIRLRHLIIISSIFHRYSPSQAIISSHQIHKCQWFIRRKNQPRESGSINNLIMLIHLMRSLKEEISNFSNSTQDFGKQALNPSTETKLGFKVSRIIRIITLKHSNNNNNNNQFNLCNIHPIIANCLQHLNTNLLNMGKTQVKIIIIINLEITANTDRNKRLKITTKIIWIIRSIRVIISTSNSS